MKLIVSKAGAGDRKLDLEQMLAYAKRVYLMAEIGSYAGESAEIFMSSGKVKNLVCIDPWKNGYDDNDSASSKYPMEEVEASFDLRTKPFPSIVKMKMTSEEAARDFGDKYFNLIYIDGKHTFDSVFEDIEIWKPKLMPGGFIAGHDYNNEEVKRAIWGSIGEPDLICTQNSWIKKI